MIDSRLLPIAEISGILIPLAAIFLFMMIPIIGIMAWHQQRMAMLVNHEPRQVVQKNPTEISDLRQDLQQLKELVSSLAINVDNMNDKLNRQSAFQDRVKVGEQI